MRGFFFLGRRCLQSDLVRPQIDLRPLDGERFAFSGAHLVADYQQRAIAWIRGREHDLLQFQITVVLQTPLANILFREDFDFRNAQDRRRLPFVPSFSARSKSSNSRSTVALVASFFRRSSCALICAELNCAIRMAPKVGIKCLRTRSSVMRALPRSCKRVI